MTPEGIESAKATAYFPLMMAVYVVFYSIWFPIGWGVFGWLLLAIALIGAVIAGARGLRQIRHAKSLPDQPASEAGKRIAKQMGILNSVIHPIWMIGSILLAVFGGARWIVPLIVFVIGAHFIPIAKIMDRKVDYVLGPIAMTFAATAAVLAFNPDYSWGFIAALAGLGGALTTGGYALYMSMNYAQLTAQDPINPA